MGSYIYGLENASRDFTKKESFGKNNFASAFPVSLAIYLHDKKNLKPGWVEACVEDKSLDIKHGHRSLSSLIGIEPENAYWSFEKPYSGYDVFATGQVNKSDLVVKDIATGEEKSAFEIKLTVVPTEKTSERNETNKAANWWFARPALSSSVFLSSPDMDQVVAKTSMKRLKMFLGIRWISSGITRNICSNDSLL